MLNSLSLLSLLNDDDMSPSPNGGRLSVVLQHRQISGLSWCVWCVHRIYFSFFCSYFDFPASLDVFTLISGESHHVSFLFLLYTPEHRRICLRRVSSTPNSFLCLRRSLVSSALFGGSLALGVQFFFLFSSFISKLMYFSFSLFLF